MAGVLVAALFAAATPVVGVLENPQCKPDTPRLLRVLFEKGASGWVPLGAPNATLVQLPRHWTVALHGRRLGTVTTTDPGWQSKDAWTYSRDRLLAVSGQEVPTVPNPGKDFGGWCDSPASRPLVVVSMPSFADPARWKRSQPPAALRERVFPEFKSRVGRLSSCPANAEKPVDLDYSVRSLQLLTGYEDRQRRRLVAVSMDQKLNTCDGPTEAAWVPNWYLVTEGGKRVSFIGDGLSLVDAGDYDEDGHSELVFWYSGYNLDGYVLYADEFRKRAEYLWNYH
jgi:hypothetical protein